MLVFFAHNLGLSIVFHYMSLVVVEKILSLFVGCCSGLFWTLRLMMGVLALALACWLIAAIAPALLLVCGALALLLWSDGTLAPALWLIDGGVVVVMVILLE